MSRWWWGGLAVGIGALGLTSWMRRPRPVTVEIGPLPPVPLEPWEEEAEFGGNVGSEEADVVVDEPQTPVGAGHPSEHCVAGNPPPAEVCVLDPLRHPLFAPRPGRAPLGLPGADAIWPVDTHHRRRLVTSYWTDEGLRGAWGRYFGAKRESPEGEVRRHSGVDLFAEPKDVVIAPQDGRVLAILPFHHGTWAIYLRLADGRVINLGEVARYSWRDFDIRPGDLVSRGQPLGRVGQMSGGDHMLHVQLYDTVALGDDDAVEAIRRGEMQWTEEAPPPLVLDPSAYLVDAGARTYRSEQVAS